MVKQFSPIKTKSNSAIKAILTLYGNANSGKTATLRYLFYLLFGKNISQFRILVKPSIKDFRAKVNYRGKYVLLSTVGDSEKDVDRNWLLFCDQDQFERSQTAIGRPFFDISQKDGSKEEIVIGATRINDASARNNDAYISKHKKTVSHIHYFQKPCSENTTAPVTDDDIYVLTGKKVLGPKMTIGMAAADIDMANRILEQLDLTIKQL